MRTCSVVPKASPGTTATCASDKQLLRELQGGRDAVAEAHRDVRIGVEGALRLRDLDAGNRAQPLHHIIAPLAIFGQHDRDRILRPAQRFDRGLLRNRSRVRRGVALQLHHRVDQRLGREREPDAPTGHGIGLRQRSRDQDVLLGARHGGDGERLAVIKEAAIAFVGHQLNAALRRQVVNLLELFAAQHGAAGIRGRIDDQQLGPAGDVGAMSSAVSVNPLASSVSTNTHLPPA